MATRIGQGRFRVAKDSALLLSGSAVRVLAQAGGFIVLARALGPADLGLFAAALAIATLVSPFVELGAFTLAVRDIARGVPVRNVTGSAVAITILVLPIAMVILLWTTTVILPGVGWGTVAAIGLGNFLGARLTSLFRGVAMGRGDARFAAAAEGLSGMAYLGAALALGAFGRSVEAWAILYCIQSVLMGALCLAVLSARFGVPRLELHGTRARVAEGLHFGVGSLAHNANTEFDKAILARLASLEAAGVYSAAQRVVAVAIVPAMALFGAMYRRYFHEGPDAFLSSRATAKRVAPVAIAYGAFAAVAVGLLSPLATSVFGDNFAQTSEVLRWVAPLVLLQTAAYPFLDALTGSGLQAVRTVAQVGTVLIGILLNVLLDASLGWKGAAIASIVSQCGLFIFALFLSPIVAKALARRQEACASNSIRS